MNRKRLADAYFTYIFLQFVEREGISVADLDFGSDIEELLKEYAPRYKYAFMLRWGVAHHCSVKGCCSAWAIDGNFKLYRMQCAGPGEEVVRPDLLPDSFFPGCKAAPKDRNCRYCNHCSNTEPMQQEQGNTFSLLSLCTFFTLMTLKNALNFHMQNLHTQLTERERPKLVRFFMIDSAPHYATARGEFESYLTLPIESIVEFHQWYPAHSIPPMVSASHPFRSRIPHLLAKTTDDCNTLKEKQRPEMLHTTAGVLAVVRPCGVCVSLTELYGSESVTQVALSLLELQNSIGVSSMPSLMFYDDACHLSNFLFNAKRWSWRNNSGDCPLPLRELTRSVRFFLDRFHAGNHTQLACRTILNPSNYSEMLSGINTQCCEQWNSHTNSVRFSYKNMSPNRALWFLHHVTEIHNLMIEKEKLADNELCLSCFESSSRCVQGLSENSTFRSHPSFNPQYAENLEKDLKRFEKLSFQDIKSYNIDPNLRHEQLYIDNLLQFRHHVASVETIRCGFTHCPYDDASVDIPGKDDIFLCSNFFCLNGAHMSCMGRRVPPSETEKWYCNSCVSFYEKADQSVMM